MKFMKNKKTTVILTCAMVLVGAQAVSAAPLLSPPAIPAAKLEPAAANGSWTASRITSIHSQLSYLEGTVEEFAVDDNGNTVWLVRRTGDDEDAPLIQVVVDENTIIEADGNIGNGDIIGVSYPGELVVQEDVVERIEKEQNGDLRVAFRKKEDPTVKWTMLIGKTQQIPGPGYMNPKVGDVYTTVLVEGSGRDDTAVYAERVTKQTPIPSISVAGTVIEVLDTQAGDGGFRLRQGTSTDSAPSGEDIIFHYGDETKILTTGGTIKKGDRLEVVYNGILARSFPPQGYALEIRSGETAEK